jgi:membrane-associated phospholipid phosphatase
MDQDTRMIVKSGGGLPRAVDITALAFNLYFAFFSFLNAGRLRVSIFGVALDREISMGALFLAFIVLQWAIVRFLGPAPRFLPRFIRFAYPQIFLLPWFTESIVLSQLIFAGKSHDAVFAKLDGLIFGFQPAMEFHKAFGGRGWTELFFFGYFTYYFLIILPSWILFAQGREGEASRTLFITLAAFALLQSFYVFFPVQGPKYFFPELRAAWYGNFKGYVFTKVMKRTFDGMNLGGAAFPSSHVAVSLVSLILDAKYLRKLLPAAIPLTLLLFFSTVFIYAHYAVDVFAGIAAGAILFPALAYGYPMIDNAAEKLGALAVKAGILKGARRS